MQSLYSLPSAYLLSQHEHKYGRKPSRGPRHNVATDTNQTRILETNAALSEIDRSFVLERLDSLAGGAPDP